MGDRLESLAVAALRNLLGGLPEGGARGVGRGLGGFAHRVLRLRRGVAEAQIAASFPGAADAWVRETARRCYRHFGEELAVVAGGPARARRAFRRVREPRPVAPLLREGGATEGGAIIVTGHLGNWELAGGYLAGLGFDVTAVVQRQGGAANRHLEAMRRGLGFEVAYRGDGSSALVRALRSGRILALVADQHAERGGGRLDFLGRPAWTTLGPARLCLAAAVPLFFASFVREGAGYAARVERIDGGPRVGGGAPPIALTRAWLQALEEAVRAEPAQYFWFHRRWKGSAPGHPGGNASGRRDV